MSNINSFEGNLRNFSLSNLGNLLNKLFIVQVMIHVITMTFRIQTKYDCIWSIKSKIKCILLIEQQVLINYKIQ